MKLFIDDIRNPPDDTWIVVRNYDEAIRALNTGIVSIVSFDHDLGENSKSGYDIACWIEKKYALGEWTEPIDLRIHSANPVGRKRIEWAITSISRFCGKEG